MFNQLKRLSNFVLDKRFKRSALFASAIIALSGCGGSSDSDSRPPSNSGQNSDVFEITESRLKAYKSDSPYAQDLAACAVSQQCTLNRLPVIGLNNTSPSVADVMKHVVVSHDWMGMRFEEFLVNMPADILLLFRATTAIVISDEVRPSHYRSTTGAIYLDPAVLWLKNDEKATIDDTPDYRSSFGSELQFRRLWRYVIEGDYAWRNVGLDGSEERELKDALVQTTWLLYHELAHANDCITPASIQSLDRDASFASNHQTAQNNGECVYQKLSNFNSLKSETWFDLADVLFRGDDASNDLKALSAQSAGDEFDMDVAQDAYSYSTQREDVAMAFEALMMKRNFNADRDMALIPVAEERTCDTAIVKWGQRSRLAQPEVRARAEYVSQLLLPEFNIDPSMDVGTLEYMDLDHNWCNVALSGPVKLSEKNKDTAIENMIQAH